MAGSAKTAAADAAETPAEEVGQVDPQLTRGTVAKGRTVFAPTAETRVVGHAPDGSPIHRFVDRAHGPGQEVTLPEAEILHLRRAGFLVDPNAEAMAYGQGPTFDRA